MVVKAPVDKPGPNQVAGVVRDTFAIPISGVEITIPDLQRRALSDADGKFHLADVRPGKYDIRARRLGFAPQIRQVEVDDKGGVATFELLAVNRPLPPVISTAARGGLSGTVGDTSYNVLPGATVKLLGNGQVVETDSLGHFFFPIKSGQYVVAVQRDGYADKLVSVTVPSDSGRNVTVMLPPRTKEMAVRQFWNIDDFGKRLAMHRQATSSLYTHEDLTRLGFEWISDAAARGQNLAGSKFVMPGGCYGTLNGGPEAVEIDKLTVDEVETLEVYPNYSQNERPMGKANTVGQIVGKKGVADSRVGTRVPLSNARDAAVMNFGRRPPCPVVYVWTR
jgi:hypothetical protein